MSEQIQLNNPLDVLSDVSRQAKLLDLYVQLLSQDIQEFSILESRVEEAYQTVDSEKKGLYIALEETGRMQDSPAKQAAMHTIREKLTLTEERAQIMAQCRETLIGIRQDSAILLKEGTALSDTGRILSKKIQTLLQKIIEAV